MRGKLPVTLGVAAGVVLLDQLTKAVAVARLEGQPPVPVVGEWLQLDLVRNPGAAFSLAGNYTIVISVIAIVVSVVIVRTSRSLTSTWWAVVLGGILGGALGNLIDRLVRSPEPMRGHVVDFVALPNFPVFNVADMALTCSAVLAIVLSLKGVEITTTPAEPAEDSPATPAQPDAELEPTEPAARAAGSPPELPDAPDENPPVEQPAADRPTADGRRVDG